MPRAQQEVQAPGVPTHVIPIFDWLCTRKAPQPKPCAPDAVKRFVG